jgi:alpha-glucosidase
MSWWHEGVLYQIYPRSFADANGDGVGDLRGITAKLDYLEWLGVDALWLNPTFPSPNVDWGYDVADYTGVHPELGTLADLDELIADAGRRGIRILLDLVPNHTSDRHPWFRERPEFYVWHDDIPNNWRAAFGGGSAWTWNEERGAYYLHQFAKEQPDLDWWNPEVRAEFERILRFWFDRGVAGFRIDVAHSLIHDRQLRDDIVDPKHRFGMRRIHSQNRPETHEILRSWRALADGYEPPRIFLGEAYVLELPAWATYYGSGGDELNLAFNFALVHSALDPELMAAVVAETEDVLPHEWPCWAGSNHDVGRLASRWCRGDERLARCALLILLALRGTPCLYYGDELALLDGVVPTERLLDVGDPPRDPGRTPMPWTPGDGGWRDPWLPLTDTSRNVEEQKADAGSTLHFTRELIRLRRRFVRERYERLESPRGTWAWRRGDFTIAVNLSRRRVALSLDGEPELTTTGDSFTGTLAPASGVVLRGPERE